MHGSSYLIPWLHSFILFIYKRAKVAQCLPTETLLFHKLCSLPWKRIKFSNFAWRHRKFSAKCTDWAILTFSIMEFGNYRMSYMRFSSIFWFFKAYMNRCKLYKTEALFFFLWNLDLKQGIYWLRVCHGYCLAHSKIWTHDPWLKKRSTSQRFLRGPWHFTSISKWKWKKCTFILIFILGNKIIADEQLVSVNILKFSLLSRSRLLGEPNDIKHDIYPE